MAGTVPKDRQPPSSSSSCLAGRRKEPCTAEHTLRLGSRRIDYITTDTDHFCEHTNQNIPFLLKFEVLVQTAVYRDADGRPELSKTLRVLLPGDIVLATDRQSFDDDRRRAQMLLVGDEAQGRGWVMMEAEDGTPLLKERAGTQFANFGEEQGTVFLLCSRCLSI
eukprot:SAG22_NODE_513_length_9567_cov_25.867771_3_plen_165_part_00